MTATNMKTFIVGLYNYGNHLHSSCPNIPIFSIIKIVHVAIALACIPSRQLSQLGTKEFSILPSCYKGVTR